jgi:hypothetical protein
MAEPITRDLLPESHGPTLGVPPMSGATKLSTAGSAEVRAERNAV